MLTTALELIGFGLLVVAAALVAIPLGIALYGFRLARKGVLGAGI